jgi:hypothetical protein
MRESFQVDLSLYEKHSKKYDKQDKAVSKVKEWIRKTVSPHLQRVCCKPEESLRRWYEVLKKQVAIFEFQIRNEVADKYAQAIRPLTKAKDTSKWIKAWEEAMSLATAKRLPVIDNPMDWFRDFLKAINPLMPMYAESTRNTMMPKLRENTLTFRAVANDFRAALLMKPLSGQTSHIGEGSFGPTFAGTGNSGHSSGAGRTGQGATEDAPKQSDRKTRLQSTGIHSSGRDDVSHPSKRRRLGGPCRACGMAFHNHRDCFYLFKSKAPQYWKESGEVRKQVDKALSEDVSLAEEVERLKKRPDTEVKDVKEEKKDESD